MRYVYLIVDEIRVSGIARRAGLFALVALLALAVWPGARAASCMLFCPARQDIAGLLQPVIILSGDLDEQGTPDLVAIGQEIPGDLTKGSVTVFTADGTGGYVEASYKVINGSPTAAALGYFNSDQHLDLAVTHFLAGTISVLPGLGDGSFAPAQTLALGGQPTALAAAEFTGDAITDLIVVTAPTGFPGTARVLQGDGLGGFVQIATAGVDKDPRDVAVEDFSQDGVKDIAVANRNGQSVTIVLGSGMGALGTSTDFELGASADSLVVGDLNNDFIPDIVTGGATVGSAIVTLLGDGAGGFSVGATVDTGSDVSDVTACDYDMDGNLDVMAAKFTADTLALLRGLGDGGFAPRTDLGSNSRPSSLVGADLNNDGFCDTASANQVGGSLSLYIGDGLGNVGTPAFTTGVTPLSVAAGDLDMDGIPDLVTADRDSNSITLLLGDGEGGMAQHQTLPAGPYPGQVVIDDVTGNGLLEIIVANQGPPSSTQTSTVEVYSNDGLGNYSSLTDMSAGRLPLDVITADLNGDNLPDIVAANGNSDNVSAFLSQGGGSFGPRKNSKTGLQPRSLAALQVDGDGLMDLAVSEGMSNRINVLMGAGNGTFSDVGNVIPGGGLNVDELITADFNGDSFPDLAWLDQQGVNQPATISVFLHDGFSWFTEAPSSDLPTGTFAESLLAMDMDRLGGLDLVVVNRFDDTAEVWFGDGAGHFTNGGVFGTGHEPFAMAAADFNGDGRDDLATADFNGDAVSVLLNNTFIDLNFESVIPVSTEEFAWDVYPGAGSYNVYRGAPASLRLRDYGTCLSSGTDLGFIDTDVPAPGEGFFYVATAVVGGTELPMGITSSCLKRVNRNPCP